MATVIKKVLVKFDKLKGETAKAFLLQFGNDEHWLPKSMCRSFVLNKKLGGNTIIPAWLYEKIFDELPNECNAAETVEHHVPAKIEPITILADGSLIK